LPDRILRAGALLVWMADLLAKQRDLGKQIGGLVS
jgi:hypothetical protein